MNIGICCVREKFSAHCGKRRGKWRLGLFEPRTAPVTFEKRIASRIRRCGLFGGFRAASLCVLAGFSEQNDRNASVAGVLGIVLDQRLGRFLPADMGNLLQIQSAFDNHAAARECAIGGKFPVSISFSIAAEWGRVGMTGDRDLIRKIANDLCDLGEKQSGLLLHTRASARKHRFACAVDDLDAQAFRRLIDDQMFLQFL